MTFLRKMIESLWQRILKRLHSLYLFSDINFQSLVGMILVKFTKVQKFWVGRVWLAQ